MPKVSPPKSIETDLRPISLTPVLSKIMEDFVYKWLLEIVVPQISLSQFGALKGTSTTHALITLMHKLFHDTDKLGVHVRVVLIDYKKTFDHLDQNIIIQKLKSMSVPDLLVEWVTSFLHQRQQRVKIKTGVTSDWVSVNGGVPQGTKLGPLLFLVMINDLHPEQTTHSLFNTH